MSSGKFRQMREMGMGEPVDLGSQEVFVGAFHYVPDSPRVFVMWGVGEPSPCIILRAPHALAVADVLKQLAGQSALPVAVLEERVGHHGAWVELRRATTPGGLHHAHCIRGSLANQFSGGRDARHSARSGKPLR